MSHAVPDWNNFWGMLCARAGINARARAARIGLEHCEISPQPGPLKLHYRILDSALSLVHFFCE